MLDMRRREVVTLLAGAAAAWPLAVRAQQAQRVRRIGVLYALDAGDAEAEARNRVLEQGLRALGWTVGQDLKIDYRMAGGSADSIRQYAAELAALAPDVIMPVGSATVAPVQQAAPTIPIVMVNVADPVGAGFVQSLARPGSNTTGFTNFEYSLSGKWVELLKQIAPHVTQAVVLRDPTTAAGIGQFAVIQSVAQPLTVELTPVRDLGEMERSRLRAHRQGQHDRDGGERGRSSPQAVDRPCGAPQAARRLPLPLLRQGRRPNQLWARYARYGPARGAIR
jgi:putative tryptophan/tyrosine transport system substrate-binding protein